MAIPLLLLLPVLYVAADQTIGTVNPGLDPDRITWWRGKWSPAPILLSLNNKSVTGVSVTFYYRATTSIAAGVLEIQFPSGFGLLAVAGASGQIYRATQTIVGGVDSYVTVTGVTNPSSTGPYGPFALRTRYSSSGQTIDLNLNFGSVYIVGDAGTLGSLSVSLNPTGANSAINKSGNSLIFKFRISVSLWRFDTFVVNIDSRWTIGTMAGCSSQDYAGRWNNFNGSNPASPHSLNCIVSGKTQSGGQTVYIYGLAVSGVNTAQTTDNQYVALQVNSVTTPDRVLVVNNYSWTVATTRFGTNTVLETGSVSGSPTVFTDIIYSVSWKPTWGMPIAGVIPGLSIYMDLSFSLANQIPQGGGIAIVVSEDVVSGSWPGLAANCYVVTTLPGAICSTGASGVITVNSLPLVPQGTLVTIRNIVKFTSLAGAGAKVTSIGTYDGTVNTSNAIDSGLNLPLLTISSAGTLATSLEVKLVQGTGVALSLGDNPAGGTGDSTGYLTFRIKADNTVFTATSQVTFYCPIASSMDDFSLSIPAGVNNVWKTSAALPADMTVGTTAFSSATITPGNNGNLGTIQWAAPAGLIGLVAGTYISAAHYMNAGATIGISLPRVAVNLATAYECRMEITDSTGVKPPHRYATQITVSARPYALATFELPCLDGVAGAPGIFKLSPDLIPFLASTTTASYYIEFQISMTPAAANTATGLTIGTTRSAAVSYPVQSSASGASATIYSDTASTVTLLLTGYSQISPGLTAANKLSVYFPLPNNTPAANLAATISSTYILQSDPRYAYVTFKQTVPLQGTTTTAITATAFAVASGTGTALINGNFVDNTTGLSLSLKLSAALTQASPWLYVIMPAGTVWGSNKAVLVSGGGFGLTLFFSSPINSFAFPAVLVQAGPGSLVTNTAEIAYTLKGFSLPLGASTSLNLMVVQGNDSNSACAATNLIPITAAAGAISSVSISPKSVGMRGPEGVNIQLALTFQLSHGLPAGGSIQLVIPSSWQTTACGSTCLVTGLRDFSLTAPLQCLVSANTATITSFADFQSTPNTLITLTISRLLPPLSSSTYNFVQSLSSFTANGLLIDTYTVGISTQVTVTAGSGTGLVNWQEKKTFPMNALATFVDLYLRFSLTHMLPACGVLTITSPLTWKLPTGDVKNNCYLTPTHYTSCSITSTGLELTVSADTPASTPFELYLDSAVDNPGAQTTSGFRLTATWYAILLDSDPATLQPSQLFTPTPLLTSLLVPSSAGIGVSMLTSGEPATYTFNFTDTVAYTPGDQYWVLFPPEFDPFLGDISHWFSYEPNTYYISCSSPSFGAIWCVIDHGIVVITGKTPIVAGQLISISLFSVLNPAPGITSDFAICHLSSNNTYLTVGQAFGKVTIASFPTKLDFREISATSYTVQQTSTLVFRFYLSESIGTDTNLLLSFPAEYDLAHFAGGSAFSCSTTYTDESNSQLFTSLKDWNQAIICPLQGENSVILPAPKAAFAFTSALQVSWSISGVPNPQIGITRAAFSANSDFDIWDTALWPAYPSWTRKFTLFVYKPASKTYNSRAYPNLHSVYMGLNTNLRSLVVTSTAAGTQTSRITVYSGTQSSEFYISTGALPCADKSLAFTPSTNAFTPDNGYLRYTSELDGFVIGEGSYSARFRVAAATGLAKGLYLIDWKVVETPQAGVTEALYTPLPSTVVEVYPPSNGQFQIQIASIPIVLVGYSSVPIKVTCPNSPQSDLTVSLSILTSPPYLTLSPASLTFSPDINELYFQIQVGNEFSISSGSLLSLVLTLSGTDAAAYSVTSPIKFPVGQSGTTPSAGGVLTWGIGSVGRTKAVMQAKVDQAGVLYWHLAAIGAAIPSFQDLRTAVGPFTPQNQTFNSTNTREQGSGESWPDYQSRLLKSHLMGTWVGWLAVSDPTATVRLAVDWLWAGCSYQISGYLDNMNPFPIGVAAHTETFVTLAVAPVQPFSLKFQGAVPSSQATSIGQLAAKYQGVNPQRLLNPSSSTSFARRNLQTLVTFTTFSYTLAPARDLESSDPASQAVITGTALTSLKADLNATLGITSPLYSVVNTAVPAQISPIWTVIPKAGNATSSSLTVSMRSSVLGLVCCEALTTSTSTPTAQQILSSLSPANEEANAACTSTNMTQTVDIVAISNLTAELNYYIYCTAVDNYPLWPTLMTYSASSPLLPITMQTSAKSQPSSVQNTAKALACLLLFLLA